MRPIHLNVKRWASAGSYIFPVTYPFFSFYFSFMDGLGGNVDGLFFRMGDEVF